MITATFATVALCATQAFANHLGPYHGHGLDIDHFGFKGAFRGKGSVWRYGDKYDKYDKYDKEDYGRGLWDKYDGKYDGKYDDKYDHKYDDKYYGKYDKDVWGGKYDDKYDNWGKGLDLYHPDRSHWSNRFCQKVCEATPGCRRDPQAHGSYCKFQGRDGRPAVCFGLYRIPKSLCRPYEHGIFSRKFCFEPFSRHCNDARLQPVRCDREPTFDRWGAIINLEVFLEGDERH